MNACSCPIIDPSVSSPLSALCAPRESDAQLFARTKQFRVCCKYLHGRDSPRVQATSLWPLHAAKGTRPHAPPTAQMREGLRGSEGFAPSCSSSPGSLLLSLAGLAEVVQFARSVRLPLRNPRPNPSTHAPPLPNLSRRARLRDSCAQRRRRQRRQRQGQPSRQRRGAPGPPP